jgi:hypothetical protein
MSSGVTVEDVSFEEAWAMPDWPERIKIFPGELMWIACTQLS